MSTPLWAGGNKPMRIATHRLEDDRAPLGHRCQSSSASRFGVFAPAQLSAEFTDRLNPAIRGALDDPKLHAQFESEGATPAGMSAVDFASFVRADVARWAPIVQQSGARPD